jgi:hypothetical protein
MEARVVEEGEEEKPVPELEIISEGMTFEDYANLRQVQIKLLNANMTGSNDREKLQQEELRIKKTILDKYESLNKSHRLNYLDKSGNRIHIPRSVAVKAMRVFGCTPQVTNNQIVESPGEELQLITGSPTPQSLLKVNKQQQACQYVPYMGVSSWHFLANSPTPMCAGVLGLDETCGGFAVFQNLNQGWRNGTLKVRWQTTAQNNGYHRLSMPNLCRVEADVLVTGDYWHNWGSSDSSVWIMIETFILVNSASVSYSTRNLISAGTTDNNRHYSFWRNVTLPDEAYLDLEQGDVVSYWLRLHVRSWSSNYGIVNVNVRKFGVIANTIDFEMRLCD